MFDGVWRVGVDYPVSEEDCCRGDPTDFRRYVQMSFGQLKGKSVDSQVFIPNLSSGRDLRLA